MSKVYQQLRGRLNLEWSTVTQAGYRLIAIVAVNALLHASLGARAQTLHLLLTVIELFVLWVWVVRPLRRATRTAQQKAARTQSVVDDIRDYMMIFLDADGCVRSWNAGAEEITGYSAEEVVGSHVRFLDTPEDRDLRRVEDRLRRAESIGTVDDEGWRVRKDGSRFWGSATLTALYDPQGDIEGFVKILRNRTARREAQEALQSSEERLTLALEGGKIAMWDWDLQSGAVFWSSEWVRMLGYDPDRIGASGGWWQHLVHPDDFPRLWELLRAHLQGETPFYECTHRLRSWSGSWLWVLARPGGQP